MCYENRTNTLASDRDDQRRGGGNPAPATTYIILSRSGAGYLGSYMRAYPVNADTHYM